MDERISANMPGRVSYTVRDLATATGVSRSSIYNEMRAGKLVGRKLGTKTLFLSEDVARWVESWEHAGAQ